MDKFYNVESYMPKQIDLFNNELEGYVKGNIFREEYIPYKGYTPKVPKVCNEKERLAQIIRINYNYLHDLNLYLDVHPDNSFALEKFKEYRDKYLEALKEYEMKYPDIDLFVGDIDTKYWKWLDD